MVADTADVRQLDLSERTFRTKFGGLFIFVPYLVKMGFDRMIGRCELPGSKMIPPAHAMRSLLALKLFGSARHSLASPFAQHGPGRRGHAAQCMAPR